MMIIIKENEVRDQNLDLVRKVPKRCNMRVTVILVVIGTLGTVPKSFRKGTERVGGLVGCFSWHINLCRLSNAISIFLRINCSISNNSV